MASTYLTFHNGTREVPDGKWYQPAAEYIIVKGRERVARVSLEAGMAAGLAVGLFIGLSMLFISKLLDGSLGF